MKAYLEAVQSRTQPVSSYEKVLSTAIEQCFSSGAETPQELADGLNEQNVPGPNNSEWTADSFVTEMARLGE